MYARSTNLRFAGRLTSLAVVAGIVLLRSPDALADGDTPDAAPAPSTAAPSTAPSDASVVADPPGALARATSVVPEPMRTTRTTRTTFDVDPLADGAILIGTLGFSVLLALVNSTGEIRPQAISPSFERSQLLGIDRVALSQTPDPHAGTFTNYGVALAGAFAVIDPVLSGFREQSVQSGIADAFMYGESVTMALATTDLVKMAVRRPRPRAYLDAELHKNDPSYSNPDTDSALSFFSGHTAVVATVGATATYLAFARAPGTWRPWVTLGVSTTLTSFVAVERVRAGAHFPTDVIAAALAGAGIGVLVPHLHRSDDIKERRVWVGVAPRSQERGGSVSVSGIF